MIIESKSIICLYFSKSNTPPKPKNPKIDPTQEAQDAVGPKIEPNIPDKVLKLLRPTVAVLREFFNSFLITKIFIVKEREVRLESKTSKNQSFRVKMEI
ncbi:hypothetical protein A2141_05115 [Candidatus Woesebacteria bacterium RBG_16_40_11]|nr:MAG: hypothetical protein A2141_05115 [Candidatus Woesebacteria bacterium RBG_16_40_11]